MMTRRQVTFVLMGATLLLTIVKITTQTDTVAVDGQGAENADTAVDALKWLFAPWIVGITVAGINTLIMRLRRRPPQILRSLNAGVGLVLFLYLVTLFAGSN